MTDRYRLKIQCISICAAIAIFLAGCGHAVIETEENGALQEDIPASAQQNQDLVSSDQPNQQKPVPEDKEKKDEGEEQPVPEDQAGTEAGNMDTVSQQQVQNGNGQSQGTSGSELTNTDNMPSTAKSEEEKYAFFNDTLFIGDSRTEGFMLYTGVDNAAYFCGKGLTVDKILEGKKLKMKGKERSVYDLLEGTAYNKIYIALGMNELGWYSMEVFKDTYRGLLDVVQEKQPEAQIYLQAVLPVTEERSNKDKTNNNAQIYWYNVNIVEIAKERGIKYVNPASAVVDGTGFLDPQATTDGIHLNKNFCKKWADYLINKPEGEQI